MLMYNMCYTVNPWLFVAQCLQIPKFPISEFFCGMFFLLLLLFFFSGVFHRACLKYTKVNVD